MVIHTLAVSHVVSAVIALALILMVMSLLKGGKKRQTRAQSRSRGQHGAKHVATLIRQVAATSLWAVLSLAGCFAANKRYPRVEPVLRPFEEGLYAHGHRLGHALCIPLPLWPRWVVRCRGCHAWAHFREAPSPQRNGVDLKLVGGTLCQSGSCPARYLTASHNSTPGQPRPGNRP